MEPEDAAPTDRTLTNGSGEFSFEIKPERVGKKVWIWAVADKFRHSQPVEIILGVAGYQRIPLQPAPSPVSVDNPPAIAALSCLGGTWKEQLSGAPDRPNTLRWEMSDSGGKLQIRRQDGFVSGTFSPSGSDWNGELNWGNGDTWKNVILSPNSTCTEIRTNQFWWYKRP